MISIPFHVAFTFSVRSAFGFTITFSHKSSIVMKLMLRISHVSSTPYVQLLCFTLSILYVDPFRINQNLCGGVTL
ncbi:hypothetical protein BDR05DRAFT_783687 [Suillus weaverae]|nr:hypothetical protein BDR05DRAFT_783687 [Suillus weaverae]